MLRNFSLFDHVDPVGPRAFTSADYYGSQSILSRLQRLTTYPFED